MRSKKCLASVSWNDIGTLATKKGTNTREFSTPCRWGLQSTLERKDHQSFQRDESKWKGLKTLGLNKRHLKIRLIEAITWTQAFTYCIQNNFSGTLFLSPSYGSTKYNLWLRVSNSTRKGSLLYRALKLLCAQSYLRIFMFESVSRYWNDFLRQQWVGFQVERGPNTCGPFTLCCSSNFKRTQELT